MAEFDNLYAHGFVRVAAASPRVHLADPASNARETIDLMRTADTAGATVCIFPELGLSGYTIDDLHMQAALLDAVDRQIGELSGGQKKRVFVARALAQSGRVILLDEPFTGVDVGTEEAIVALLRELRDEGRLILVSTHNLGSVPEFCDQVVLINRTVLAYGPTSEVFTADNLTRAFGGALRLFDLAQSTVNDHDGRSVTVLTDDERPLVLGKRGHLEYLDRTGREKLISDREEEQKGKN
jgi:manganese/iron transport system ATP-binding protein